MSDVRKVLADVLAGKPVPKRVRTNLDGSPVVQRPRDYAAVDAARTKILLQARVRPEVLERVDRDAKKYRLTRSEYLAHLVMGQPLPSNGSDTSGMFLTIAGNANMRIIAALEKRIVEGEGSLAELLSEFRVIQRSIVEQQIALTPAYEAVLAARTGGEADQWDDNETPELPRKRAGKRP